MTWAPIKTHLVFLPLTTFQKHSHYIRTTYSPPSCCRHGDVYCYCCRHGDAYYYCCRHGDAYYYCYRHGDAYCYCSGDGDHYFYGVMSGSGVSSRKLSCPTDVLSPRTYTYKLTIRIQWVLRYVKNFTHLCKEGLSLFFVFSFKGDRLRAFSARGALFAAAWEVARPCSD